MSMQRLTWYLMMVAFVTACGGGGGDVIDLVPDIEEPTIFNIGVDAGDMDGDGLADIVIAGRLVKPDSATTGHIDVLVQDISRPGTFLPPRRYPTSALPRQIKLSDLNGDMQLDVIATNRYSGKSFDVLLQDSLNAGQLLGAKAYTTVSQPHGIATGDIDQDGFVDIAIAGETSVDWHRQQSNGSFGTRKSIGTGVDTVALADLNGDGLLDVATQDGIIDGDLLFYLQRSGMTGAFNPPAKLRVAGAVSMLATGDFTGNGRVDIAVAGHDIKDLVDFFGIWYPVLQTSSNPLQFAVQPRYGTAADFTANVIAIADLNGDQRPDVVIGNSGSNVEVYLQTSATGTFGLGVPYVLPSRPTVSPNTVEAVSIADLNNDLLPDIVAANDDVFVLFQRQGNPGTFGAPVRVAGSEP